jgi:hypothetical protein
MTFDHDFNISPKHNTVSWGNLLVTVFAAPYLDRLLNAYKSQTSKSLHQCNAIPEPAAPYFANTAPYRLATGTIPCQQTGQ